MSASRPQRHEPGSLMHVTRHPQRRSRRRIRRSMLPIAGTESSHLPTRRSGGRSIIVLTLRSGVRSTAQPDMIWRSTEFIWITRRCQIKWWSKSRTKEIIVGTIPTMLNSWVKSTSSSGGSLLIASKTQGKKLEREINSTQRIELGRRMK
jgi:hypothetical protein